MELAPTQDESRLRPQGIMDLLDAIFRLYRNNFLLFSGIVGLVLLPILIIQSAVFLFFGTPYFNALRDLQRSRPGPGASPEAIFSQFPWQSIVGFIIVMIVFTIVAGIGTQFMEGALANAISQRYLGRSSSLFGAYGFGIGRGFSLVGAALLRGLMALALIGIPFFGVFALIAATTASQIDSSRPTPSAAAGTAGLVLCMIPLMFVFVLGVLALMLRFLFTPQAIVIEGLGPISGLGRSWNLSKGAFWRIVGISVLMGILVWIITVVFGLIAQVALTSLAPNLVVQNPVLYQVILTIPQSIIQIFIFPLQLGINTLLYFDLRVRKEAFDLQLMETPPVADVSPVDSGLPPLLS